MNNNNTLPEVLTAKDLQAYLHISRAGAYNLLNRDDFPTLHIGCRKLVSREHLLRWIEAHTNAAKITL
ncbi:MAG: helix-turn-helix domain-containing protein [Oscillospiraceae bacterium]|nr:helix-turn-helix domain-containing protein [Oscillospiraceae bacterium]